MRNEFIDVATGESYTWEVNHAEVPLAVRNRTIEYAHPTAAGWQQTAPVMSQGHNAHQLHRLEGMIANQAQHEAFMRFWLICATRSIHFLPCMGGRLEVVVRSYTPTRRRLISGPRGAQLHVWNYTIDMEIVTEIE